MASNDPVSKRRARTYQGEVTSLAIAAMSGLLLVWQLISHEGTNWTLAATGIMFSVSAASFTWLILNPESVRAQQTDGMLTLARKTLSCVQGGLDRTSAQQVCELLLPNTAAVAVAITDCENVLGYAGYAEIDHPAGGPIRTRGTQLVVETGQSHTMTSAEEIGFPFTPRVINAAIVVPLKQGRTIFGTLKFYYRKARNITETQTSIAEGFGHLLSTQLAAEALEEQTKLATSMELKALQAQINPHFLFNTINTMASLVRTDPDRARILLREFAVFYRHTLEDTGDLVALSREVEQTMRYFQFEVARFGEDKLQLDVDFEEGVEDVLIPAFLIQPLVENAVRHGRPTEGTLHTKIKVVKQGSFLILDVADDGVGMNEKQCQEILHPDSSTGLGIAVKNVHDRVESYFGEGSHMEVESTLGKGTTVRLVMNLESENLRNLMLSEGGMDANEATVGQKVGGELESSQFRGKLAESGAARTNLQEVAEGTMIAAVAASAEEISAAEVRSVASLAKQSETTGVADKFRAALSSIDELEYGGDNAADDDDDDWDYDAEMAEADEMSDEDWARAIAEFEDDGGDNSEE